MGCVGYDTIRYDTIGEFNQCPCDQRMKYFRLRFSDCTKNCQIKISPTSLPRDDCLVATATNIDWCYNFRKVFRITHAIYSIRIRQS